MMHAYNRITGGEDESDKMLYSHLEERTMKFWEKVVFNIFLTNTSKLVYKIYQHNSNNKKMTGLEFTSSVISPLEKK